jgi:GntR family transcriptional regulator
MKFVGSDPIYIQIANYIKKLIEKGAFSDGAPIPSVRDFGAANSVNPNTVARAYDLLVDENVIISIPKKGYFVKTDAIENSVNISGEKRLNELKKKLDYILGSGYTKEEIIEVLEKGND